MTIFKIKKDNGCGIKVKFDWKVKYVCLQIKKSVTRLIQHSCSVIIFLPFRKKKPSIVVSSFILLMYEWLHKLIKIQIYTPNLNFSLKRDKKSSRYQRDIQTHIMY